MPTSHPSRGFIGASAVFANILSIGYEFETHDLAKMSEAGGALINADTTAFSLRRKMELNEAAKADSNNYEIIDNDELFFTEYIDEPDDARTALGASATLLQVTNDVASTEFTQRLFKQCSQLTEEDEDVDKNDLYSFRVKSRKKNAHGVTYPITFTEPLQDICSMFTGLEMIVTFYHPSKSSNIILETFMDACKRILEHTDKLVPIPGALFLRDQPFGTKRQLLYHSPNTNLYYLQTPSTDHAANLAQTRFTPQMTLRTHIRHLVPIMLEMLRAAAPIRHPVSRNTETTRKQILLEHDILAEIHDGTNALVRGYNASAAPNESIGRSAVTEQMVVGYLVLILYKLEMYDGKYRRDAAKDSDTTNYLKNYLAFASRHSNFELYDRLVGVLSTALHVSRERACGLVAKIVDQPSIVYAFMYKRNKKALTQRLHPTHANFGNPSVSLSSYFAYMERAMRDGDEDNDWLASVDRYTNTFPIGDNNEVMVENRMFPFEISYFANAMVGVGAPTGEVSLEHMRILYDHLVVRGVAPYATANIGLKEYNPKTRRRVNKAAKPRTRKSNKG